MADKKVALITGGGRGIGFGISRMLAKDGFDLVINGVRDVEQVKEPIEQLRKLGAEVLYCRGDISVKKDRDKIIPSIKNKFGKLNVLVNNAGVGPKERADILTASEESFEWIIKVNLQGPYFLTQAAANFMIEQKSDEFCCIINVTSISSTAASVNRGDYCISKAGLSMASNRKFTAKPGYKIEKTKACICGYFQFQLTTNGYIN